MNDEQILELVKQNPIAGAVAICVIAICVAWILTTMIREMNK